MDKWFYEAHKVALMKAFDKLLAEAEIYKQDEQLIRRSMRNVIRNLDDCVIYAHPEEEK